MALLRITRRSNDAVAVIGMIACMVIALGTTFFMVVAWRSSDPIPAVVGGVVSVFLAGCGLRLLGGIVSPYENEFVMEEEGFRFGRADRPGQQRRIARDGIECLILDPSAEPSLSVFTGGRSAPYLAAGIIVDKTQMLAVAEAVREYWREIPVHDRQTFQSICSEKRRSA